VPWLLALSLQLTADPHLDEGSAYVHQGSTGYITRSKAIKKQVLQHLPHYSVFYSIQQKATSDMIFTAISKISIRRKPAQTTENIYSISQTSFLTNQLLATEECGEKNLLTHKKCNAEVH
jgi:hypothetical protein